MINLFCIFLYPMVPSSTIRIVSVCRYVGHIGLAVIWVWFAHHNQSTHTHPEHRMTRALEDLLETYTHASIV